MQRPVADETGLDGTYNFLINPAEYAAPGQVDIPSLMITALREGLGLRLESRDLEIEVMVIDQLEQPSAN